ncbi:thioredoxin family protein [bacterium]|nr:thioredoxin family protein [bacterium]
MANLFKTFGALALLLVFSLRALGAEGYPVSFSLVGEETLKVEIKPGAYLYADFSLSNGSVDLPAPAKNDLGEAVYKKSFSAPCTAELPLEISFRCCDKDICYPPQTVTLGGEKSSELRIGSSKLPPETEGFKETKRAYGYMSSADFKAFLYGKEEGKASSGFGIWALVILFFGGLLLNLTPCVLPVIPMTLAVLGAKYEKAGPRRGALLGATYGLGMTLTYGTLGAIAIFIGGSFGQWYDLWYFRAALALLFIVLGLAMLDLFILDWSRFIGRPQNVSGKKGSALHAFFLGVLAALLAGACVAPVIVYALAQGAELYNKGNYLGLLLPFVLGLGLASPWPFLGAGLSFLPKPGGWMVWVKRAMAVVLIGLGIYYAIAVPRLFRAENYSYSETEKVPGYYYNDSISAAFKKSRAEKKPLVVDCSASWCASCKKMERKTFRDPEIRNILTNDFVFLNYRVDADAESKLLKMRLDLLQPKGLPAVIILEP